MKRAALFLILVILLVPFLAACDNTGPARDFVPLPPPATGFYPVNYQVLNLGGNQIQKIISPHIEIDYAETSQGIGGIASEKVCLGLICSAMSELNWGDWFGGRIRRTEYYSPDGELVGGMILLNVPEASFLPIFKGEGRYILDRSRFYLVYRRNENNVLRLSKAVYLEQWGSTDEDPLALGLTAVWDDPEVILPPHYRTWGFWEEYRNPFDEVKEALRAARKSLREETPKLLILDEDTTRELLGRQSGFKLYVNGERIGKINMEYRHTWGQQPNTAPIGKGALSRVDWEFQNGEHYVLLVISPELSPVPTTLYIFLSDPSLADELLRIPLPQLYKELRRGVDGVILAVYASGTIGKIEGRGTTSEGKTVKVDVGAGGGIYYATVTPPTFEEVKKARDLIDLLGQGGIKGLGFYYAYKPGSGSGLYYYLSMLKLMTAPNPLEEWGVDVGVLDRVGFSTFPLQ